MGIRFGTLESANTVPKNVMLAVKIVASLSESDYPEGQRANGVDKITGAANHRSPNTDHWSVVDNPQTQDLVGIYLTLTLLRFNR